MENSISEHAREMGKKSAEARKRKHGDAFPKIMSDVRKGKKPSRSFQ